MRPANPHRLSFTAPARSVASVSAALPSLLQPVPHSPPVSDRARSISSSGDSLHSFVKKPKIHKFSLRVNATVRIGIIADITANPVLLFRSRSRLRGQRDGRKLSRSRGARLRPEERKNMAPGSLMKAIIRPAHGAAKSAEGDQVIFHCTTRTLDGVIVDSTRSEHGGKGNPLRYVLGKGKMILGFSEGIPTMFKGEVAMFKKKPEVHYAEAECPVTAPDSFPKHEELRFEIENLLGHSPLSLIISVFVTYCFLHFKGI